MPEKAGKTIIKLDFAAIIMNHVPNNEDLEDAIIDMGIDVFFDGELQSTKKLKVQVKNNKVSPRYFQASYQLPGFGYVQISLFTNKPYFSKIEMEKGYGLLVGKKAIISTILPQSKYAEPIIIGNMKTTGTFNLVNPAHYLDKSADISNSALLINPYDGPIVAIVMSDENKKLKKKMPGKSAIIVDLTNLISEKRPTCVLYSGSNRYTGWDIRHKYGDINSITNIDHLEYYRAIPTYKEKTIFQSIKHQVKKVARNFNRY